MSILFAYIASQMGSKDWPIRLIYATEVVFVAVAIICFVLAQLMQRTSNPRVRDAITIAGGIGAGFGLVMPFELAPLFFGAKGEIMMISILLIFAYPLAVALFIALFRTVLTLQPPELPKQ